MIIMGEKNVKLKRILDRDDWRCGIHMGGCGDQIENFNDANIDHIIPRSVTERRKQDELVPLPQWKEYKEFLMKIGILNRADDNFYSLNDLNIQPMHKECNTKKSAEWPPTEIISHCDCCKYFYMAERNIEEASILKRLGELKREGNDVSIYRNSEGKIVSVLKDSTGKITGIDYGSNIRLQRPVLPMDRDHAWKWHRGTISLLRRHNVSLVHGGYDICYSCARSQHGAFRIENESTNFISPWSFVFIGHLKHRGKHSIGFANSNFKTGAIGNCLTIDKMLHHNTNQNFKLNEIWDERDQLSAEENTILTHIYGHMIDNMIYQPTIDWYSNCTDVLSY